MTLKERVEAAARAINPNAFKAPDAGEGEEWTQFRAEDRATAMIEGAAALACAFPELFRDPPSAWIAPWDYTEAMSICAYEATVNHWPERIGEILQGYGEVAWVAMRDTHVSGTKIRLATPGERSPNPDAPARNPT